MTIPIPPDDRAARAGSDTFIPSRVRCKFVCADKRERTYAAPNQPPTYDLAFGPVYSGSPENKAFFYATPSGSITFLSTNAAAAAAFQPGKEYYVDFTPAAES